MIPVYYVATESKMFIVGVYVDDIIIESKNEEHLKRFKQALSEEFDVKDLGRLHGIKIIQDNSIGDVRIGQPAYTNKVLEKFEMQSAKSVATPVDPGTKLVKADESDESYNQSEYQSAVGSLLYLSIGTRPDVAFTVSNVAKFCSSPTRTAVKRIFRYIRGTSVLYTKHGSEECVGYSD